MDWWHPVAAWVIASAFFVTWAANTSYRERIRDPFWAWLIALPAILFVCVIGIPFYRGNRRRT